MGAAEHDLHGEACFVGVAGVEGFERLDRGDEAALVVLARAVDRRREGIAEFGVIFAPGGGGEGGHWFGSGFSVSETERL
jgi:hypothetical protein